MILYLLLFCVRVFFFRNPRNGLLCCGLFGVSANRPLDAVILRKLKVLGLFNQSRGEDSCGYYNGEKIVKGVDNVKKWTDFVMDGRVVLPAEGESRVFFGHVRKSTVGSNSEANAHPFNVEGRLILAHNGTLENHWPLMTEAGLPHGQVFVDSHALAILIDHWGYSALEKYKGYAALLFHHTEHPDELCVYHGASRTFTGGQLWEERPLFWMDTKDGIYISSLEEALKFIREEGDDEPLKVPHNRVFTLKGGEVEGEGVAIDREDMNITVTTSTYTGGYYGGRNYEDTWESGEMGTYMNDRYKRTTTPAGSTASRQYGTTGPNAASSTNSSVGKTVEAAAKALLEKPKSIFSSTPTIEAIDLESETVPVHAFNNNYQVYYFKNRYYLPDGNLCEGEVVIDKNGRVHQVIPEGIADELKRQVFYFYRGIMLNDLYAYKTIKDAVALKNGELDKDSTSGLIHYLARVMSQPGMNFAMAMSEYAKYPVTNLGDEAKELVYRRTLFFKKQVPHNGSITPLFSNRDYHYRDGVLISIKGGSAGEFLLKRGEGAQGALAFDTDDEEKAADSYSAQYNAVVEVLDKTYPTLAAVKEAVAGVPELVIQSYVQDILEDLNPSVEPHTRLVERMCLDMYLEAVTLQATLRELLQYPMLEELESYIDDVLMALEEEAVEGEDDEPGALSIPTSFDLAVQAQGTEVKKK